MRWEKKVTTRMVLAEFVIWFIVLFGKVGTVGIYGVDTRCRFQPIVLPQPLTGISQKAYHPAWKTLKILFWADQSPKKEILKFWDFGISEFRSQWVFPFPSAIRCILCLISCCRHAPRVSDLAWDSMDCGMTLKIPGSWANWDGCWPVHLDG